MKIEIKDTGMVHDRGGDIWAVYIDGKRHDVAVWQGSGFYGADAGRGVGEHDRMRDAIAIAVSPEVEFTDQRDSTAAIRRAVRDLTRCLEIRAAVSGVKLPRLRGAK